MYLQSTFASCLPTLLAVWRSAAGNQDLYDIVFPRVNENIVKFVLNLAHTYLSPEILFETEYHN